MYSVIFQFKCKYFISESFRHSILRRQICRLRNQIYTPRTKCPSSKETNVLYTLINTCMYMYFNIFHMFNKIFENSFRLNTFQTKQSESVNLKQTKLTFVTGEGSQQQSKKSILVSQKCNANKHTNRQRKPHYSNNNNTKQHV